jgi:signal transduction histidine kinase
MLESSDQISKCEMELGRLTDAEETAKFVLQMAQKKRYLFYAKESAQTLAELSTRKGDYESAFKYQKMQFDFSAELTNEATQNRIASLNYSMSLRAKEAEIEVLNRDRQINGLITTMAMAGLAVFILFAIALVFFYQRIRKDNRLLAKQNEALGELNREKDSLINIVAHDLKSPISKTKGLLRMLSTLTSFTEQQQKVAGMMEKTLDDGERLIRDLLDISYAEGSNSHFKPVSFELVQMVRSLVEVQAEAAKRKEIEIEFASDVQELEVYSDDSFLSRILDNLMSNAVKYSPKGSKVWVEMGKEGQNGWFSVKDKGPGFTAEDKERMFRKFQKLSARPTAGESSNGLGLAIIQVLSQQIGGKVSLETEPGKGSKFKVSFPLSSPKKA